MDSTFSYSQRYVDKSTSGNVARDYHVNRKSTNHLT